MQVIRVALFTVRIGDKNDFHMSLKWKNISNVDYSKNNRQIFSLYII